MSELKFIDHIRKQSSSHPLVRLGIGDDAAVLTSHPHEILVTTDTILDGRHFQSQKDAARAIGHKAIAVNLSDCAAMGGLPEVALLAVSVSSQYPEEFLQALVDGIFDTAQEFNTALAGGDTTAWSGPLAITMTLIGRPHSRRQPIRRDSAKPGDLVMVTGPLGDSLASGHHLNFTPRIRESQQICQCIRPTSMIDLSDGLATDLGHILTASHVGATLFRDNIPLRASLQSTSATTALTKALCDGEDFELCFTVSPQDRPKLDTLSCPLFEIGVINPTPGLTWDDGSAIEQMGFEHQF
jgi:thiamine-monophosphate kinase